MIDLAFALAMDGKSDAEIMTALGMSGAEFEKWKSAHPLVGLHFATIRIKNRYFLSPTDRPSEELLLDILESVEYDAVKLFTEFGISRYILSTWVRQHPNSREILAKIRPK